MDVHALRSTVLGPQRPWRSVDGYDTLDSTNLEALRRPDPWRVVVADHQSAGRGRLSRRWEAPAGASVAVSAVVPMSSPDRADWGWLPLLAGMAVARALERVAAVPVWLKWPNDVLVQEAGGQDPWRKVAGVLCEMAPGGAVVVVGVGANVDQGRPELPVDTATSLRLCGAAGARREDVVAAFLHELVPLYRGWQEGGAALDVLRGQYRARCLTLGRTVDLHQAAGGARRGVAVAVDDSGRVVLEAGAGCTVHAAGDVVHVRRAPEAP